MGVTEKVWDVLTTIIKMNDKVMHMTCNVKDQQQKLEYLTERVIRLEATLELLMRSAESKRLRN